MFAFFQNPTVVRAFSLAGSLIALLGVIISGIAYRGKLGERYSALNHYISELGEVGVARLAWVFNLGMILTGLCLLPACLSLGFLLPGFWAKLAMAAGLVAAISVSLVGVFPMNNPKAHSFVALSYFRAGLVMVILFTLVVVFQKNPPVMPRLYALVGVPAILAYASFLVYGPIHDRKMENVEDPLGQPRQKIWWVTVIEWMVFATTIPWFLVMALGV
jgi:hypothetical membrane protein